MIESQKKIKIHIKNNRWKEGSFPNTPEGEEVDDNGWGKETQQQEGDVTVKHHPLGYWVDHTTGTIIVDREMRQRVWWGDKDWVPELVIEDIMILLGEE